MKVCFVFSSISIFQIGKVLLQTTVICIPSSRIEQNLGPGGYNAMHGHGEITTKVLQSDEIQIGDPERNFKLEWE